jgi:preprotein translocase subunit SecE
MADKLKLIIALLVVVAALFGFYYFEGESFFYRVLGLVAAFIVAAGIVLMTETGRNVRGYIRGATIEVRKVVWPTRKETTQTTLIVFVMVVLVGIFLWLIDMFATWAMTTLTQLGV